jgi:hypothetical protein
MYSGRTFWDVWAAVAPGVWHADVAFVQANRQMPMIDAAGIPQQCVRFRNCPFRLWGQTNRRLFRLMVDLQTAV